MSTIKVKDGDIADQYYRVIGGGGSSDPYFTVTPDYHISEAINRIENDYSDTVSVWNKAKTLIKFGRNATVGTSWETLAEFQGTVANETFVTTNIIDSIVSSSTSDTTQTIVIEGHTIDGSGNLTFVTQEKALTGQTEATLTTPLARVGRAYVKPSGTFGSTPNALVGNVSIYDNTGGVSSGVPTTASGTKIMILAGETQSQKCSTSISSTDYWIITGFSAAMGITGGASVDYAEIKLETRDIANGGVWRPLGAFITIVPNAIGTQVDGKPYLIVPKNHDVRLSAKTNANTAEIYGQIKGYLAIVV